MLRRPDSNRFKGAAFITLASQAAVAAALQQDGAAWLGTDKCISVQRAGESSEPKKRAAKVDGAPSKPSLSVYVGNLPADATVKSIKGALGRVLGQEVKMHKVHLMPAREERCAAFVDFEKREGSAAAVKLSGTSLLGRVLTLSYSERAVPIKAGNKKRSEAYLARRKEKREAKNSKKAASGEAASGEATS